MYRPTIRRRWTRRRESGASEQILDLKASKEGALVGAAALVICTEWKEFRAQDAELFVERLGEKLVIDGRNLYEPARLRALGLRYECVGRPS